jgi:hypothetical protein
MELPKHTFHALSPFELQSLTVATGDCYFIVWQDLWSKKGLLKAVNAMIPSNANQSRIHQQGQYEFGCTQNKDG